MKAKFALLIPLAILAVGVLISPARANPKGDHATVGPSITAQRSERPAQTSQARRIGQPIKGGNYIGFGASSDGAVVNGKYALSNNFSVRPGVMTSLTNDDSNRNVSVLVPVTYDFNGDGSRMFQPFVGAGAGLTTGDATEIQLVTTVGADLKLGKRYTLNGSANYLPLDGQSVDAVVGLGYGF